MITSKSNELIKHIKGKFLGTFLFCVVKSNLVAKMVYFS